MRHVSRTFFFFLLTFSLLIISTIPVWSAGSANNAIVTTFAPRSNGHHEVYVNVTIPNEGCDLVNSRMVIVESDPGGETLVKTTMALRALNAAGIEALGHFAVDGCAELYSGGPTAPKVVKINFN